jgi:hypothetical protein
MVLLGLPYPLNTSLSASMNSTFTYSRFLRPDETDPTREPDGHDRGGAREEGEAGPWNRSDLCWEDKLGSR